MVVVGGFLFIPNLFVVFICDECHGATASFWVIGLRLMLGI
jgi:hypothetical protein